jgi:hypothetical protein
MTANRRNLNNAVAHFLFIESKDFADGQAGVLRAAALVLLGKQLPTELLNEAAKRAYNDNVL